MNTWLLRLSFLGLLILPMYFSANAGENGQLEILGKATDLGTGEAIYTEHHFQTIRDDQLVMHRVEYIKPDGSILAVKNLDYSKNSFAPDFSMEDRRDGYMEGGRTTNNGYQLEVRESKDEAVRASVLKTDASHDLVVDAGFDLYVKDRLDSLRTKGTQAFKLGLPSRLTSYRFTARTLGETTLFDRPAIGIRVELGSLLKIFADSIDITYDLNTGQLLRYEGMSNIRNQNGERYDARIDFDPADRKFTADSEPEGTAGNPGM